MDTARLSLTIDTEPTIRLSGSLPFVYAAADTTGEGEDQHAIRLYHCPTDPTEELRLTWDALRRQHAGFCKACRKLWPLPRRVLTPEQLRAIADKRQLELVDLT
jgi:hypothetical protein